VVTEPFVKQKPLRRFREPIIPNGAAFSKRTKHESPERKLIATDNLGIEQKPITDSGRQRVNEDANGHRWHAWSVSKTGRQTQRNRNNDSADQTRKPPYPQFDEECV